MEEDQIRGDWRAELVKSTELLRERFVAALKLMPTGSLIESDKLLERVDAATGKANEELTRERNWM